MDFQPKDLAFKIVDDTAQNITHLDLRIVCGTGTNPTMVDFHGKSIDKNNLQFLRDTMQATLDRIAKELNVLPPQLDTSPSS
jgi:hypothetical protein